MNFYIEQNNNEKNNRILEFLTIGNRVFEYIIIITKFNFVNFSKYFSFFAFIIAGFLNNNIFNLIENFRDE